MRELFEMEIRTQPKPGPGEDNYEIRGTPYEFDFGVIARTAEFVVKANSVEAARPFYRPILDLCPAGRNGIHAGGTDTIAVGTPTSLATGLGAGVFLIYQAWESTSATSTTITIQVCNPTAVKYEGGAAGVIRIDIFKR